MIEQKLKLLMRSFRPLILKRNDEKCGGEIYAYVEIEKRDN